MNSSKIYHMAISILMDISSNDPEDNEALAKALVHLKNKRLAGLGKEHKIPSMHLAISFEEFDSTKPDNNTGSN